MGHEKRSKGKRDNLLEIRCVAFTATNWITKEGSLVTPVQKSHTERILQEEQQTQTRFSTQSEAKARQNDLARVAMLTITEDLLFDLKAKTTAKKHVLLQQYYLADKVRVYEEFNFSVCVNNLPTH